MESFTEKKTKRFALSLALGIHVLLLLFFLFTGFIVPEKVRPPDIIDASGSLDGYKLTELIGDPLYLNPQPAEKLVSDSKETKYVLDQGNSKSAKVNPTIEEEPGFETALRKLRKFKNSPAQLSGSVGTTAKEMGKGRTETTSGEEKNQASFYLKDRALIGKPLEILNEKEEGKVVVDIVVDDAGKVISASPGQRGSTTTSSRLYKKAVQAVLTAEFSPSSEGIKEQRGTYTFVFTLE